MIFKMILARLAAVLMTVSSLSLVRGYRQFADKIPNGVQVPHPCKDNILWHGVGHFNVDGGGFRNQFGLDFKAAGSSWTEDLCRKDSDGDGRTNGEELGDPGCVWKVGGLPNTSQGLSHPGICDPISSEACKARRFDYGLFHNQGEWMDEACKPDTFNCPAITQPDVRTVTKRLDLTPVPAKETTYICQIFEFPEVNDDYHLIASTPVINNTYIMHHMVIFGCEDDVATGSAFECDMLPDRRCKLILTIWTLGQNGDCFHPDAGVRMGKNGLKKFAVQLHWNNPSILQHMQDSSGFVLHYTPHLRPYDSSVLLLGSEHFHIPPRTPSTRVASRCAPSCTRAMLDDAVYVTAGFNHMHYLGRKMRVEQLRNGSVIRTLMEDLVYDYDSPKTHKFQTPLAVLPGDELRTTCEYSSMYRTTTTFFGESTAEEMCYAFLYFYPVQNIATERGEDPFCSTWGSVSHCDPDSRGNCTSDIQYKFYGEELAREPWFPNITRHCPPSRSCDMPCLDALLAARDAHPCFLHGDNWDGMMFNIYRTPEAVLGRQLLAVVESCRPQLGDLINPRDPLLPNIG